MSFHIKLSPNVIKFLDKQLPLVQIRIKNKLRLLKENPFHFLEHFEGDSCHKLRIGDYRALIDVDSNKNIIFVRIIDHRRRIYKR